ncbi:pilus assembly protein [Neisseria sp. Ec49-e6-T10]|uniref:pilus assembly protein n=1 Tax=Neisseria sp. Ec49-e6-T10 TaxID=3140744 RepID=UPI003EBDB03D
MQDISLKQQHNLLKKIPSYTISVISLSTLLIFGTSTQAFAQKYPFPSEPVNMQPYINKTKPILWFYIDNTATMNYLLGTKYLPKNTPSANHPTRLDMVKLSLLKVVDTYYDDFNFGVVINKDYNRVDHWQEWSDEEIKQDPRRAQWVKNKGKWLYTQGTAGIIPGLPADKPYPVQYHYDRWFSWYGYITRAAPQISEEHPAGKRSEEHKEEIKNNIRKIAYETGLLWYSLPQLLSNNYQFLGETRDMPTAKEMVHYRCQDSFVIVMTDGDDFWSPHIRDSVKEAATTHPKSSNQKDLDGEFYNQEDFPNQYITSSAIGLTPDMKPKELQQFASIGKGFSAIVSNTGELIEVITNYIESMKPKNSFYPTVPAASYVTNDKGDKVVATLKLRSNNWQSDLNFDWLNAQGNMTKMGPATYDYGKHIVLGSHNHGWVNLTDRNEVKRVFNNDSFGLNTLGKAEDDYYLNFMPWLTTSVEEDKQTGYRKRAVLSANDERRFLGDVLNSPLLMSGPIDKKLQSPKYLTLGSNDGMFKIYTPNKQYGQEKEITLSDGTKTTITDYSPYTYTFGYFAGMSEVEGNNTLYNYAYKRADADYGTNVPHQYGVNGGTAIRYTNKGQLFAVASLGQGGKGTFALNIGGVSQKDGTTKVGVDAEQNTWKSSIPLWDSATNPQLKDDPDIGYTTGKAMIAPIAINRTSKGKPDLTNIKQVAVVPNGYSSESNDGALYIIDTLGMNAGTGTNPNDLTEKGTVLKKFTIKNTNKVKDYGLSSPTPVDLDNDGIADIIYVGDRAGDIYRVDLRKEEPDQWTLTKIYEGLGGTNIAGEYIPLQPITTAPHFSQYKKRTVVVFGTGSVLYADDINVQHTQTLYGIYDDLTDSSSAAIKQSELTEQTISTHTDQDKTYRFLSENPIGETKGWYINLPVTGEKIISDFYINDGTVVLSTNIVSKVNLNGKNKVCFRDTSKSSNYLMFVNAVTGGALKGSDTTFGSISMNGQTSYLSGYSLPSGGSPLAMIGYFGATNNDGEFNNNNTKKEAAFCEQGSPSCERQERAYCKKGTNIKYLYTDTSGITHELVPECSINQVSRRIAWRYI